MILPTIVATLLMTQTAAMPSFLTPALPGWTALDQAYGCHVLSLAIAATVRGARTNEDRVNLILLSSMLGYYLGWIHLLDPDDGAKAKLKETLDADDFPKRWQDRCIAHAEKWSDRLSAAAYEL